MDSTKPLSAIARPKGRIVLPAIAGEIGGLLDSLRTTVSAVEGALLFQCVWYDDLDAAGDVLRRHRSEDFLWSDPKIEYRYETVTNHAGVARQRILEPIMLIDVTSPADFIGNTIGDLSSRHGLCRGQLEEDDGSITVRAEVPLADLHGYSSTMRAITSGRGVAKVDFLRFDHVPRFDPDPTEPMSAALKAS